MELQQLTTPLSVSFHSSCLNAGACPSLQVSEPTSEVPDHIRPNHLIKELTKEIRHLEVWSSWNNQDTNSEFTAKTLTQTGLHSSYFSCLFQSGGASRW